MFRLEYTVVSLMKQRVTDVAVECLLKPCGEEREIKLNGKQIQPLSFHNYARLYVEAADKDKGGRRRPILVYYFVPFGVRWCY